MRGRGGSKPLFFIGLFIVVTGLGILSWFVRGVAGSSEEGIPINLGSGEVQYGDTYMYLMDSNRFIITFSVPPNISYTLNISKVGGDWSYSIRGRGHNAFNFRPPYRGVYKLSYNITADNGVNGTLTGVISLSINTGIGGDMLPDIGTYILILGTVLMATSVLIRRV